MTKEDVEKLALEKRVHNNEVIAKFLKMFKERK